jgi:hypothetical protein
MKAAMKPRPRPSPDEASTLAAIEARAKAEGTSLKLVICRALAAAGIEIAPAHLEDGTPRRRAA